VNELTDAAKVILDRLKVKYRTPVPAGACCPYWVYTKQASCGQPGHTWVQEPFGDITATPCEEHIKQYLEAHWKEV